MADNNAGLRAAVARQSGQNAAPDEQGAPGGLVAWLEVMKPQMARALPAGGLSADRLARIVLTEVRRTPLLARCTQESFLGALMTCAQLGLEPGTATGEAYLIPFRHKQRGHEVTLIIGYQGMTKLYWQSPLARTLDAQVVYEHDDFDYCYGLNPKLEHRPSKGNRGDAVAYYAVASFTTGGSAFVVMSPDDIERIRERSRAKDDGPWKTDYDEMAKKTCLRRLFKMLPKSTQLAQALAQDEQTRTDSALDAIDFSPDDFPEDRVVDGGQTVNTRTGEVTESGAVDPGDGADSQQTLDGTAQ